MGIYLNPENVDFQEVLNSKIYVDKSELIQYTNSVLRTTQKYICVVVHDDSGSLWQQTC